MTIPHPFTVQFPLKSAPFNSRVESQIDSGKNYYAVAFKPGFPLQAAELNEIQEIFYVQQTLSHEMFANWGVKTYLEQGSVPMTQTPWNGCTPLNPNLISTESETTSISITCKAGWYLVKQVQTDSLSSVNSGISVWVYNPTDTVVLSGYNSNSSSTMDGDYGVVVKPVTINCSKIDPPAPNEDISLKDSSNINAINGPCGAGRLKLEVVGFGKTASTGQILCPIFSATRSPGLFATVSFKNGYIIKQVNT
jgi:hypothetical protein